MVPTIESSQNGNGGGGGGGDPMDVSGGRQQADGDLADLIGNKRPLDPLADENSLETVRDIRRRLVLGTPGAGGVGVGIGTAGTRDEGRRSPHAEGVHDSVDIGGGGGGAGGARGGTKLEINNADLAELLRSTKPKGNPRQWAKILYQAQNRRRGAHAGREKAEAPG